MSSQNFKTQIKKIRKEAIELGFSIATMDGYEKIWEKFILWKKKDEKSYRLSNRGRTEGIIRKYRYFNI